MTNDSKDQLNTGKVARTTQPNLRARTQRKPRPNTGRGTKPEDIERWERDYKCVELRRIGRDWDSIVAELGYSSKGHAHDRFMAFMAAYPRDNVETMRELALDAIEKKMTQLEPECEAGNARAIEVWNKLSERMAKLEGLDKPERKEVTVLTKDVVDAACEQLEAEMAQLERQRDSQKTN